MKQWLVISILAITAIMVNVAPKGGANVAVAVIAMILLAVSATLMERKR